MLKPLLTIYDRNLDLANRLVADLEGPAMVVQPAANVNHAAWIIGHLAMTCDVAMMALGEPKVAPAGWRDTFGARTTPVADVSAYPDKQTLLEALTNGHARVGEVVAGVDEQRWLAPPADARFAKRWPALGEALLHVMVGHEQMHLGQLSAWRRVQGLPPV